MAAAVHGPGDTWEVFVVGVRDRSHASTVLLAAELSRYTGMPTSEVELALMKGELHVRHRQLRDAADASAAELEGMGAVVDLRLSEALDGGAAMLKPDASRSSGVAVGGFIDDSATPPALSARSGMIPIEPEGMVPPPPEMGTASGGNDSDLLSAVSGLANQGASALGDIDAFASEEDKRVVDMPAERSNVAAITNRASAAPVWVTESLDKAAEEAERASLAARQAAHQPQAPLVGGTLPSPALATANQPVAPVAPMAAAPMATAAPMAPQATAAPTPEPVEIPDVIPELLLPDDAVEQSASLMAGLASLEVTDLPSAEPLPEEPKKPEPALAPTMLEPTPQGAAPAQALELDFVAAGLKPKTKPLAEMGGVITGQHRAVGAEPPRRTRAGDIAGSGTAASGYAQPPRGRFLLGSDNMTSIAMGLGLALIVGLVVAIQLERSGFAESVSPLEEEFRVSTTTPHLVEAGELRSPDTVEDALKGEYKRQHKKFLFTWLAIGVPLGFAISRIPRR